MISFQMARELRIDVERRLYADDHVTRLVRDPSNCENVMLVFAVLVAGMRTVGHMWHGDSRGEIVNHVPASAGVRMPGKGEAAAICC